MRPRLLLDTSVWIDAIDDASLLKRARRANYEIAIADDAVLELVSGAVTAATRGDGAVYERCRAACGQATAYASVPTQPIGCHLASLIGLQMGPPLDLRGIVREVSTKRTAAALRAVFRPKATDGTSLHDWPEARDAQRLRWRDSIMSAFATHGTPVRRIDADEYALSKAQSPDAGNRSLVRIEAEEVKIAMDLVGCPLPLSDASLVDRLSPHLAVYLEMFREACFDRYPGPHNDNTKKIRFEPHDWNDLSQFRYIQGSTIWVTSEHRWPTVAKRTRFAAQIVRPESVNL